MKKYLLLILISSITYSNVDTTVFKYFPLKVGNKWSWFYFQNFPPGSFYKWQSIESTQRINDKFYYYAKTVSYSLYTQQYATSYSYYRFDSVTGNLYIFDGTTECIVDSMNCGINDSAYIHCNASPGQWYRHSQDFYPIFNQNYPSKIFLWSNYFEAWGKRVYAQNIGRVYVRGQAVMSITEETLRGCVINGIVYGDTSTLVGFSQISTEVPGKFSLSHNYPNPFNPTTNMKFQIPKSGFVKLTIFNVLGKEVQILVNQQLSPGTYSVDFDGSNLPSGVYYYRLESNSLSETKKMVLIK